MAGIEEITIVGVLSKDPELKYSASGMPVCRFSIPVDRKVGDEYKTVWWNITCFNKTAEGAANNLHKDSVVRVSGVTDVNTETMTPAMYEKDGEKRTTNRLLANTVNYISNFGKKDGGKKESAASQDELPF